MLTWALASLFVTIFVTNKGARAHVNSQHIHPSKKDPWLNDLCQHEQQYNTKSNQDEEALHDTLESLLVLNLAVLYWLKES